VLPGLEKRGALSKVKTEKEGLLQNGSFTTASVSIV
jgi:hypothetical protein